MGVPERKDDMQAGGYSDADKLAGSHGGEELIEHGKNRRIVSGVHRLTGIRKWIFLLVVLSFPVILCVEIVLLVSTNFFDLILSNTWQGYIHLAIISYLVCIFVMIVRGVDSHNKQLISNMRNKINEEFLQLNFCTDIPAYSFSGQTAEIISDREMQRGDSDIVDGLTIMRYARNSYGEYFFFMSDGEMLHIFKHIEHRYAQEILKDKYIPPNLVGV